MILDRSTFSTYISVTLKMSGIRSEREKFEKFTTDKVKKLLSILEHFNLKDKENNDISMTALIFVQERHLCVALSSLLITISELFPEKFDHLKVAHAVGGNTSNKFREPLSKELKEKADMDLLKLQKTIEAFKQKRINR